MLTSRPAALYVHNASCLSVPFPSIQDCNGCQIGSLLQPASLLLMDYASALMALDSLCSIRAALECCWTCCLLNQALDWMAWQVQCWSPRQMLLELVQHATAHPQSSHKPVPRLMVTGKCCDNKIGLTLYCISNGGQDVLCVLVADFGS